jgi:regulator of sirC expression with transglutaminase-like and TPR domain
MKRIVFTALVCSLAVLSSTFACTRPSRSAIDPVQVVRSVMSTPDDKVDFARAKLTFDKLYDPASTDIDASLRQIDGMVQTVRAMAGPRATPQLRLVALRTYIYKAGPWNDNNPFTYDFADPLGRKTPNKLLATYLRTRRGNCVSMPMLFVALAQRLDLDVTLSTAPHHVFVKYHDAETGRWINLETTGSAKPARDVWLRQQLPMTDEAIANGIYMKTLSKREALVVMADIVLVGDSERHRYDEMLAVADVLRPDYPNNLTVLLAPAIASDGLAKQEFIDKYSRESDIPPELLGRLDLLARRSSSALDQAYALGWRPTGDAAKDALARAAAGAPKIAGSTTLTQR